MSASKDASPALLPPALPWARARLDAAEGPVPDYGSPEWEALPHGSPAKVAACIIAAECWRTTTDPAWLRWRLATELHAPEDPAAWTPDVVEQVHRTAHRPSFAELCRRRGEPDRAARAIAHEHRMDGLMSRPYQEDGRHG
jgi:hypothetical protein